MGDIDIRFYLSILLRRLPYCLAILVLATAAGVTIAYMLPSVYRASARILVEAPQIPAELARSTVPVSAFEQLQILGQQITTRENMLAVAERLHVYGDDFSKLSSADVVEDMRSRTTFEQVVMDASRSGEGVIVFAVSFDHGDPVIAAKVVNELVSFILARNARTRADRAEDTLQFFAAEVDRLGANLTRLDQEILRFKNNNKDALPDSLEFRRNQQRGDQERLSMLEREEASLRSRRNNLVQMFETTGLVTNAGPATVEQQMLQDLNRALSSQLAIFSEDSPNIIALKARITALQEKVWAENRTNAGKEGKKGLSELDLQLSDIDERLRFIAEEKTAIARNLENLARSIAATPRNEMTLNALELERGNVQAQYKTATAKLAEASTGEQIEARSKGGRFSVVEPAVPPEKPISPDRKRIAAAGVAAGICLGLGFVVLLELLNKSIRRPAEITRFFQVQPLATVPYIRTEREGWLRKRLVAGGAVAAGAAAAVLLLLATYYRVPASKDAAGNSADIVSSAM
ncbi:polysaccharide chain length determinant protein (PEP-CTERM system associated) [Mesorhizobium sp. J18]|uniref:GumC family protein n=1 Tax=Mesorhizobium sp. J18 TaxID=935263 RepID=UPI00119904C0|nr:Wzz/FepE/Etk N-terminal domain-containing protein [Mesorhizobium sp. J18]TWG96737.1 polysaccharide chain length determinant protein (PEP-CTERM system associated) [Mesorhizobium sp. J18]